MTGNQKRSTKLQIQYQQPKEGSTKEVKLPRCWALSLNLKLYTFLLNVFLQILQAILQQILQLYFMLLSNIRLFFKALLRYRYIITNYFGNYFLLLNKLDNVMCIQYISLMSQSFISLNESKNSKNWDTEIDALILYLGVKFLTNWLFEAPGKYFTTQEYKDKLFTYYNKA